MRKLRVFESVTLDGYFSGLDGDMNWAYAQRESPEFQNFVQGNAATPGVLLLGRVTYQMMESYWPTPLAEQTSPVVAKGMNEAEKLVFSRTLNDLSWANARVVTGELRDAVRALKQERGRDLVVLGSGTLVAQLTRAGLVDEYQLVVKPVVLGKGRSLFEGIPEPLQLMLTGSRVFPDGNVVLSYVPSS